jgi:hypothetical protein
MTAIALPPGVHDYAAAVRAHLAGLDPEVLDELTGGLEADLAESFAEQRPGQPADREAMTEVFGTPQACAVELSVAAGVSLPDHVASASIADRLTASRGGMVERTRSRPWFPAAAGIARALRPVWWVARGWALGMLVLFPELRYPFGASALDRTILLTGVVLSVLWGQRLLGQQRWWRRAGLVFSALAAVVLLPVLLSTGNGVDTNSSNGYSQGYAAGQRASWAATLPQDAGNLFVYDADGEPVESAQIIDQDGDPVVLRDPATQSSWSDFDPSWWSGGPVPAPAFAPESPHNVYPWSYVPESAITIDEYGTAEVDGGELLPPRWPSPTLFPVEPESENVRGADGSGNVSEAAADAPARAPSEAPDERVAPEGDPSATESPTP